MAKLEKIIVSCLGLGCIAVGVDSAIAAYEPISKMASLIYQTVAQTLPSGIDVTYDLLHFGKEALPPATIASVTSTIGYLLISDSIKPNTKNKKSQISNEPIHPTYF